MLSGLCLKDLSANSDSIKLWVLLTGIIGYVLCGSTDMVTWILFIAAIALCFPFPESVECALLLREDNKLWENAVIPSRGSEEAAGFDLFCASDQPMVVDPGHRIRIPTGLAFSIPYGYCGIIFDRSSVATREGLIVIGGLIDPDYTGHVEIAMLNSSDGAIMIKPKQKIAQIIFIPYVHASMREIHRDKLKKTARGSGGFGSTDVNQKR